MDAYIKAKASKDDQILLECEQWELNSWPKVALKMPAAASPNDIEDLARQAEKINVNYSVLYRKVQFTKTEKINLTPEEL
jgi:hypothetical protein